MKVNLLRFLVNLRSRLNSTFSKSHPPRAMPAELANAYTMGNAIPVLDWYIHEADPRPLRWTTRSLGWSPKRVARRGRFYYGDTDLHLYAALDAQGILNRDVVILGSETPWYECICAHYGARVTTIEYRDVDCRIPGLRVLTPAQYWEHPAQFDVALSISSIEHAGLGRYGDPLAPDADLAAMDDFARFLRPGGRLVLSVPVGSDAVVWNAHRIYGRRRLARLFEGWRVVQSFGFEDAMLDAELGRWDQQPVWLLEKVPG